MFVIIFPIVNTVLDVPKSFKENRELNLLKMIHRYLANDSIETCRHVMGFFIISSHMQ